MPGNRSRHRVLILNVFGRPPSGGRKICFVVRYFMENVYLRRQDLNFIFKSCLFICNE